MCRAAQSRPGAADKRAALGSVMGRVQLRARLPWAPTPAAPMVSHLAGLGPPRSSTRSGAPFTCSSWGPAVGASPSISSDHARHRCAAGTCGAGSERGNGTVSAGALDAGCGDRVLTRRISRGGYPTCGRRPGARRQRGRRPFGCGVRCPGQGHMPRGAAIRGLLTTLNSPPSTRHPQLATPRSGHLYVRILQYVPRTVVVSNKFTTTTKNPLCKTCQGEQPCAGLGGLVCPHKCFRDGKSLPCKKCAADKRGSGGLTGKGF